MFNGMLLRAERLKAVRAHELGIVDALADDPQALGAVGLAISLFTGRGAWMGALRMVLIGGGAGLTAYFVGRLLGVAIA